MIGRIYFETTDGKQSLRPFEDYGLLLVSHDETPPAPRIYRVELDGADGTLDLSEWAGEMKYDNRTVEIVFRDMSARHREFVQKLLGRVWRITFFDDEEWFFEGRCEGIDTQTRRHVTDLTLTFTCKPYKMRRMMTTVSFTADVGKEITLRAARKAAIPTVTASAPVTMTWQDVVHTLPAGESSPAWLVVTDKAQTLTIAGGADETLTPADFALWYVGAAFKANDQGVPAVVPNERWDMFRHALAAGTKVKLISLARNDEKAGGVYPIFYERNSTYVPLDLDKVGETFVADALLINCLKTVTTTEHNTYGAAQVARPAQFALWYAGHAFKGNDQGVPTVVTIENWDIYRYAFGKKTKLRLDGIVANSDAAGGVYPAGYEVNSTYYPIDNNEIGNTVEADALIVNCRNTPNTTGGTPRVIFANSFELWSVGRAFMYGPAQVPAVVEAENRDIYRYALAYRQQIRLDDLSVNNSVTGVYPAGYELDSTYYPLDIDKEGQIFEADALILNCLRATTYTGGTQRTLTPPTGFEKWYANHAFMANSGVPTVTPVDNWDIYRLSLGGKTLARLDALTPNQDAAGVYPLFYEVDGTYYPLDTDKINAVFEAEAVLVNGMRVTTQTGDAQQTKTPSDFSIYSPNHAFMGDASGRPVAVENENWDIYSYSLGGTKKIRLDKLTINSATAGVYPAGYLLGGTMYPLDLTEENSVFNADALLLNCRRDTSISGGTWTPVTYTPPTSFSNVYPNGALMQNGENAYVQIAEGWDIFRVSLGGTKTIKVTSVTQNSETAGTMVLGYELNSTYYPIKFNSSGVDSSVEYKADALVINRLTKTSGSWDSSTLAPAGFSVHMDGFAMMNDGAGGVYYKAAENCCVYRKAFAAHTKIKCTSITQGTLSGVTIAAYELDGALYPLSANSSTVITCDAILINCHMGGFPVTLTPPSDFYTYQTNQNRYMNINSEGTSEYVSNTNWDVYTYELGSWKDVRIDSVTYNPQVQGVYAIGCWIGSIKVVRQEDIEAKTVYNANTLKVNYFKGNSQFAATAITYTPDPNTPFYSATSISIQTYTETTSYEYSAKSFTISRYNDDGTPVTTQVYSCSSVKYTPNIVETETVNYSATSARLTTGLTKNDTRSFSSNSVTITPDINSDVIKDFSMEKLDYTPVVSTTTTTETTRDYSMINARVVEGENFSSGTITWRDGVL